MKKITTTKIAGVALASTMIFGCGSVLAAPAPAVQQVQAEGQTMAAYSTGDLSVNSSAQSTSKTFYFTPLYDGNYSFTISNGVFSDTHLSPKVFVGESQAYSGSFTMYMVAGRTYAINASLATSAVPQNNPYNPYYGYGYGYGYGYSGYNNWNWNTSYYSGTGSYDISVAFAAPEIEPEVAEEVTVQRDGYWNYTSTEFQFTPETTGEYQVEISDVQSQYDWIDYWNPGHEIGEMTPTVSIYSGEELIFFLEGEGADVTKLDENTTYLVVATADHVGTYTLTIAPAPVQEVHYTEEQLRAMSTNNFVGTLYTRILGRFSDSEGRAEFTEDLLNQGYTATQIATIMFTSEEFGNLNMDDATFISTAFYTFCDRDATAEEAADLMAGLAAGTTTRAQIVEQLAASDEWASFCAFYGVNV
ncbi:MAG: DUF4214 domain-containing protein [Clostridiales bacterium]|nr:DUF4214 domain-containing protein [Clostridiales bacterium]